MGYALSNLTEVGVEVVRRQKQRALEDVVGWIFGLQGVFAVSRILWWDPIVGDDERLIGEARSGWRPAGREA